MHRFHPRWTTWHVTFGTYGTRLHGGNGPTVDRHHNRRGQPFIWEDACRYEYEQNLLRGTPVVLTPPMRRFIQERLPGVCDRGGWTLRTCAAQDNHIHTLLDIDPNIHGEQARRLMKRWLGQALNAAFGRRDTDTWWAEQGSNIPVTDQGHFDNVHPYIERQRA